MDVVVKLLFLQSRLFGHDDGFCAQLPSHLVNAKPSMFYLHISSNYALIFFFSYLFLRPIQRQLRQSIRNCWLKLKKSYKVEMQVVFTSRERSAIKIPIYITVLSLIVEVVDQDCIFMFGQNIQEEKMNCYRSNNCSTDKEIQLSKSLNQVSFSQFLSRSYLSLNLNS